ncbi:MAG TPA: hypothetical protein VMF91_20140 [Bryobacteraceae bacterium]|nr:hypothetical protein [Bryobacteraceae bacterium]
MGTQVELPESLVREIEARAAAEQLTPGQFIQRLVEKHLENKSWHELIEKGLRQSQALGYSEDDVERLIHAHRAEKRQ